MMILAQCRCPNTVGDRSITMRSWVFRGHRSHDGSEVHPGYVLGLWTTREQVRQLWRHWSGKATVRFLWLQAETTNKNVRISNVPGLENVADANTQLADRRSLEFCRLNVGVTEIPKQFRDTVL